MENFLEEFISNPGLIFIGEKIFQYLDVKELNKCRSVKRSWKNFIENQRFFYKLLIAKVGEKLNLSHFTLNFVHNSLLIFHKIFVKTDDDRFSGEQCNCYFTVEK